MRLSKLTGDYSQAGGITDRIEYVSVGGELDFELTFIEGSEEVYINGARQFKGADKDYTTSEGKVSLNEALTAGDEIILVGRATTNEIPFKRSSSESVTLTDGQLAVEFQSIGTEGIDIHVSGPLVDRGRLVSPEDYTIVNDSAIELTHTFPSGSIIEGVQGGRISWVDPDNMMVNDGSTVKSLSARFRDTQESRQFLIETTGMQIQDLVAGMELARWVVDRNTGGVVKDSFGEFPILKLGKSYWLPQLGNSAYDYTVSSWSVSDNILSIQAIDTTLGGLHTLKYLRKIENTGTVDVGRIENSAIIGTLNKRIPIFDADKNFLGYVPIYS